MSSYQPNPSQPNESDSSSARPVVSRQYLDERHAVETPEQICLQFTVAGIGSRFLAIAIDTVIQIVVGGIVGVVLVTLGFAFAARNLLGQGTTLWMMAGVIAFYFLLYFGYFIAFEILWSGQTPGKRMIGIRVIKDNGRPLNAVEVIGRNLLRIVDQLPSFYVVGIVTALCNPQSKRLGDFVAGSIIIRDETLKEMKRPWEEAPMRSGAREFIGAKSVIPEEIALVNAFLGRRAALDSTTRHRMASEILERVGKRILITSDQRTHPEQTLEALSYEYRQS